MPIVPERLFSSALGPMQQRCEVKKKEGEALQLCLRRKVASPQLLRKKPFMTLASHGPQNGIPKQAKPNNPPASTSRLVPASFSFSGTSASMTCAACLFLAQKEEESSFTRQSLPGDIGGCSLFPSPVCSSSFQRFAGDVQGNGP